VGPDIPIPVIGRLGVNKVFTVYVDHPLVKETENENNTKKSVLWFIIFFEQQVGGVGGGDESRSPGQALDSASAILLQTRVRN